MKIIYVSFFLLIAFQTFGQRVDLKPILKNFFSENQKLQTKVHRLTRYQINGQDTSVSSFLFYKNDSTDFILKDNYWVSVGSLNDLNSVSANKIGIQLSLLDKNYEKLKYTKRKMNGDTLLLKSGVTKSNSKRTAYKSKIYYTFHYDFKNSKLIKVCAFLRFRQRGIEASILDKNKSTKTYFLNPETEGKIDSIIENRHSKFFSTRWKFDSREKIIIENKSDTIFEPIPNNSDGYYRKDLAAHVIWKTPKRDRFKLDFLPKDSNYVELISEKQKLCLEYKRSNSILGHNFTLGIDEDTLQFDGLNILLRLKDRIPVSLDPFLGHNVFKELLPKLIIYLTHNDQIFHDYQFDTLSKYPNFKFYHRSKKGLELHFGFKNELLDKIKFVDTENKTLVDSYQVKFGKVFPKQTDSFEANKDSVYRGGYSKFDAKYGNFLSDSIIVSKINQSQSPIKVLVLWFRACPNCIKSFPTLKNLSNNSEYKDKLFFLAVNGVDKDQTAADRFLNRYGLNFENLLMDHTRMELYEIDSYPKYFILDKQNRLLESIEGYNPNLGKIIESYAK
jgi:thiol-disulfide isomerase/thioredoxin